MLVLGCYSNASAPAESVEAPAAEAAGRRDGEALGSCSSCVLEWVRALRGKAGAFSQRLGKTGNSGSEDGTTAGNGVKEVSKDFPPSSWAESSRAVGCDVEKSTR